MHEFESPDLLEWLEEQPDNALDQLPYGVVKMDQRGCIQAYNSTESSYTGVAPDQAINKNLFSEVALCTNNFMVAGKFDQPEVDETIDYIFTYVMKPTPVRLRLLKGKNTSMYMIVIKR